MRIMSILEIMLALKKCVPVLYSFKLCRRQAQQTLESTTPKFKTLATTVFFGNDVNFGNFHALQTSRYNQTLESASSKYNIFANSCLSRSAPIPDPGQVRNEYGRARGVGAAPRRRRSNEAIGPRNSSFENPTLRPGRKKLPPKSLSSQQHE